MSPLVAARESASRLSSTARVVRGCRSRSPAAAAALVSVRAQQWPVFQRSSGPGRWRDGSQGAGRESINQLCSRVHLDVSQLDRGRHHRSRRASGHKLMQSHQFGTNTIGMVYRRRECVCLRLRYYYGFGVAVVAFNKSCLVLVDVRSGSTRIEI